MLNHWRIATDYSYYCEKFRELGIEPLPRETWELMFHGEDERCALGGEVALGYARGFNDERLCHDDERSCYHRWTVYDERP